MKRNTRALWALAVAAVFLSACGNNERDEDTSANARQQSAGNEQVTYEGEWATGIGGDMILATTTSTYDSRLLDDLVPIFEDQTGVNVKIISVGTGAALEMGKSGEADALLTHAPDLEEELVKEGHVINRHRVMQNDFVIVGPADDPAETEGLTVEDAFAAIKTGNHLFYTRGDNSGTHMKERSVWDMAGIDPEYDHYEETGQGMGGTLRIAAERSGYALADRGTFLSLQEELDTLDILVEGDDVLLNIYHVMQVDPEKSGQINEEAAEAFVSFFLDQTIQDRIADFGIDQYGQPLFFKQEQQGAN